MAQITRFDVLFFLMGLMGLTLYLVGSMGDVQFTLRELLLPSGVTAHHPYRELPLLASLLVAVSFVYFLAMSIVDLTRERRQRRRRFTI